MAARIDSVSKGLPGHALATIVTGSVSGAPAASPADAAGCPPAGVGGLQAASIAAPPTAPVRVRNFRRLNCLTFMAVLPISVRDGPTRVGKGTGESNASRLYSRGASPHSQHGRALCGPARHGVRQVRLCTEPIHFRHRVRFGTLAVPVGLLSGDRRGPDQNQRNRYGLRPNLFN